MSNKTFQIDGVQWVAGSGTQDNFIPMMTDDVRLYHATPNNRRLWALIPNRDIVKYLKRNNMNICEVLVNYPKKLYFDIDGSLDCKLDEIMEILYKYFDKNPDNWSVSGYENNERHSYHIVNNMYVISSSDELMRVKKMVSFIKHSVNKNFDDAVYSKNRNMKCIYQSKPETKNIQKLIINKNETSHLIASYITSFVPISDSNLFNIHNTTELVNSLTLKNTHRTEELQLPEGFTNEDAKDARELLKITPSADISHAHRWKVALFCYYNGLSKDEYMEWFNKSKPSNSRWAKVNYFYDKEIPNASKFAVSVSNFRKYLSIWYPELIEETHFTSNFLGSFNLDNTFNIDRIEQNHFTVDHKVVIFNIPMGGGKTTTTLKYLEDTKTSFIWMAPRQTLISNISHRLKNENHIEHTCHLDVAKDKTPLKSANKLLICSQSLHYVEDKQNFDTVVIDEIETALNGWDDDETHKSKMASNFKRFCSVIQKAKKVILLDAFITTKTIKFINSLGIPNNNIMLYNNTVKTVNRTLKFNNSFDSILNKIVDDIRANKKLFIFYAFKNASENGHYSIIQLDNKIKSLIKQKDIDEAKDLETIKQINSIETENYKQSLLYYAESKEKNQLGDVNVAWANADYVITTSSITVGVNYEGLDYDKVYLLCSGIVNNPRDILQCSMRIRKPKENTIELFFFDLMTKDFKAYPNYYHSDNNIYKSLINNVYAEQQSDFAQSFRKFCDLTGYDYSEFPELKFSKKRDSKKFINDMFESRMLMEYSTIEVLDDLEMVETYEQAVYNRTATLQQRFAVSRFYFDERFKELDDKDRAVIWNNRAGDFFRGIKHKLIGRIMTENNITSLADLQLNKLELSDGLKEDIKTYFSYDIKMKNQLIVKTINNLLCINAIEKVESSKGKHVGFNFSGLFAIINDIYIKLEDIKKQKESESIEVDFIDDSSAGSSNNNTTTPSPSNISAGLDDDDTTLPPTPSFSDFNNWFYKLSEMDKVNISDENRCKYKMYLLDI